VIRGFDRRSFLHSTGLLLAAGFTHGTASASDIPVQQRITRYNLNENSWGPSPFVLSAIQAELVNLNRYADEEASARLRVQIAAHERVAHEQVILGEILGALGLYLGSQGEVGGEFLYSKPGYMALIDAAQSVGGVGVGVPLNAGYANDLPALAARISAKTRAVYLVNPHNPTGTANGAEEFLRFVREASQRTTVIIDEAYLEYTTDFKTRSTATLVREDANVLVFRTFDKIHGLAGLPIGYTLAPRRMVASLRGKGLGDAESLGRLNIAAASAALADTQHVAQVRDAVARERAVWHRVLDELHLEHTSSEADFVFFNVRHPHDTIARQLASHNILVAREFAPFNTWIRITIGKPEENLLAQTALRSILANR